MQAAMLNIYTRSTASGEESYRTCESEEWAVGGQPGSAGLGTAPTCTSTEVGPLSHTGDRAKGYSEKLQS
jgi:hypothetical protein